MIFKEDSITPAKHSWFDVAKNITFILIAVGLAYYITHRIGIENLREAVVNAGVWGPLIVILIKATTIVVAPLGGTPIYVIAGALFGFWEGMFWSLVGDAFGATIAFYLSRIFGKSILNFFMSRSQLPVVEKFIERSNETNIFLKARLSFIGFPELFAYGAGLTRVSFPLFITAHMVVHAVPVAFVVAFGDLLVSSGLAMTISLGLFSLFVAFAGAWWLKIDLLKSA